MYLIVGLGNPEQDYARTRHNMGFDVINELSKELNIEVTKNKFEGLYGIGEFEGNKIILLKPQTYMNLSGNSVIQFKNFYKIKNENIIVILDDIDLLPGKIRVRRKGSPSTHNGLKSVTSCLNSEDFPRVRVGIGKPNEGTDLVEHVIGFVPDDEFNKLQEGVKLAKDAVIEILQNGIQSAMNKYN